jgi:hypothetical protein
MYAVLVVFGAVITAAGMAIVAAGAWLQDFPSDTSIVTPGTIAAIGGLVVIALGLAVRSLQRIEWVLTVQAMPRLSRVEEASAISSSEQPSEQPRLEFPAAATAEAHSASVAIAGSSSSEEMVSEAVRHDSAASGGSENDTAAEAIGVLPVGGENGLGSGRTNGGPANKAGPWLDMNARRGIVSERSKNAVFESFWPKARPQLASAQTVQAQTAAALSTEPARENGPRFSAPPAAIQYPPPATPPTHMSQASVAILKSGVVDGMAYTLYSDGSIEAQLPQGTFRFGSITELRSHIEHTP